MDIRQGLTQMERELETLTDIVEALDTAHASAKKARLTDLTAKLALVLAEAQQARDTLDESLAEAATEYLLLPGGRRWR